MKICFLHKSTDKDDKNKYRKNEPEVVLYSRMEFHALSLVAFIQVVIKTPAPFANAEKEVYKGTAGKQKV